MLPKKAVGCVRFFVVDITLRLSICGHLYNNSDLRCSENPDRSPTLDRRYFKYDSNSSSTHEVKKLLIIAGDK